MQQAEDAPHRRTSAAYDFRSRQERREKPRPFGKDRAKKKPLPRFGKNEPIPTNLLTSSYFMQAAGITVSEFRKLVWAGHVRPVAITPSLHRLYDRSDVDRISLMRDPETGRLPVHKKAWTPTAYSVEEATLVFEKLSAGVSLETIVLEMRIHPLKLAAIRDQYAEFSESIVLRKNAVDILNRLPVDGAVLPLRTDEDVIAFVRLALREQLCAYCRSSPRSARCSACTRSALRREERAAREEVTAPPAASETSAPEGRPRAEDR